MLPALEARRSGSCVAHGADHMFIQLLTTCQSLSVFRRSNRFKTMDGDELRQIPSPAAQFTPAIALGISFFAAAAVHTVMIKNDNGSIG